MMHFEELDGIARGYMLREFEAEWAGANAYVSRHLSEAGITAFPELMRQAITQSNETTLAVALNNPYLWKSHGYRTRNGSPSTYRLNVRQEAERLSLTEFNSFYVHGLTARLLAEGVTHCEVYRAGEPKWGAASCASHEGRILLVAEVYSGHRKAYHPAPGDPGAITVPFGPNCHHSIRRAVWGQRVA